MAEVDSVKVRRGNLINLETLDDGRLAFTEDEGRLYIGSTIGENVGFPNQEDLANMRLDIAGAIATAISASTNIALTTDKANTAVSQSTDAVTQSVDTVNQLNENIKSQNLLKAMQLYTATANNTSIIPIPTEVTDLVDDLANVTMDVYYKTTLKFLTEDYTIDDINNTIRLIGFTLSNGEKLRYRVYR